MIYLLLVLENPTPKPKSLLPLRFKFLVSISKDINLFSSKIHFYKIFLDKNATTKTKL